MQVFDSNNANKALGKIATQSSTYTGAPIGTQTNFSASYAVNGNLDDLSHTANQASKFNFLSSATSLMVFSNLITLTLFLFFCLGAWWEVDLGERVAVSNVTIYNWNAGDTAHAATVSNRLSNSVVSLLNDQGRTVRSYTIVDAKNRSTIDINFVS